MRTSRFFRFKWLRANPTKEGWVRRYSTADAFDWAPAEVNDGLAVAAKTPSLSLQRCFLLTKSAMALTLCRGGYGSVDSSALLEDGNLLPWTDGNQSLQNLLPNMLAE